MRQAVPEHAGRMPLCPEPTAHPHHPAGLRPAGLTGDRDPSGCASHGRVACGSSAAPSRAGGSAGRRCQAGSAPCGRARRAVGRPAHAPGRTDLRGTCSRFPMPRSTRTGRPTVSRIIFEVDFSSMWIASAKGTRRARRLHAARRRACRSRRPGLVSRRLGDSRSAWSQSQDGAEHLAHPPSSLWTWPSGAVASSPHRQDRSDLVLRTALVPERTSARGRRRDTWASRALSEEVRMKTRARRRREQGWLVARTVAAEPRVPGLEPARGSARRCPGATTSSVLRRGRRVTD